MFHSSCGSSVTHHWTTFTRPLPHQRSSSLINVLKLWLIIDVSKAVTNERLNLASSGTRWGLAMRKPFWRQSKLDRNKSSSPQYRKNVCVCVLYECLTIRTLCVFGFVGNAMLTHKFTQTNATSEMKRQCDQCNAIWDDQMGNGSHTHTHTHTHTMQ